MPKGQVVLPCLAGQALRRTPSPRDYVVLFLCQLGLPVLLVCLVSAAVRVSIHVPPAAGEHLGQQESLRGEESPGEKGEVVDEVMEMESQHN